MLMSKLIENEDKEYIVDGKTIAADIDGELVWDCHHKTRGKYEAEVLSLRGEAKVVEEKPELKEPEMSPYWGDRTPGYPEWYKETNGQDAYNEKYVIHGKDIYLSNWEAQTTRKHSWEK